MLKFSTLLKTASRTSPFLPGLIPFKPVIIPQTSIKLSPVPCNFFSFDPKEGKPQGGIQPPGKDQRLHDKDGNELKDPMQQAEEDEKEDENSFQNENKRSIYFFLVASMGLIGGYAIMQMNAMREEKKSTKSQKVSYTGKADIGGPWQLIDMQGNTVTDKNFKGSYYLLYFGFCNCPDICPISLQKISKALDHIRKMPEYRYIKLKTIFVTVDPDRDTPERMNRFLSHFDKSIIGLTARSNDDPDLKNMMNKFRIYASKIELDEKPTKPGEKKPYTLDHTIITYLMDDNNEYITHLGSNLSDRDLSQIIVDAVLTREREKTKAMRGD